MPQIKDMLSLCLCTIFISELSAPTQICVFAKICSCALTRVRFFIAHANEPRPHGICFEYYPNTQSLVVDNAYQVTKIMLTHNYRQVSIIPRHFFLSVLENDLIKSEHIIIVYKICEPGRASPKYVMEKEDHFSITLEYSGRTSILLQAACALQRLVPTSPVDEE
jgi:hypothetical protein